MFTFGKNTLDQALTKIFERDNSRKVTKSEFEILEKAANFPIDNNFHTSERDPEIEGIRLQDKIEQYAHAMRMVFVSYLDCLENPYPYSLKKNLESIRIFNKKVREIFTSQSYQQVKEYAYKDIFEGEFRLILDDYEDPAEIIDDFNSYASDPTSLNLSEIVDAIPDKYKSCLNEDWFSIE